MGQSHASAITVVLPTRDNAAALRRTFGSLRALRGVDEIIVVDDGSTDGTSAWLGRLNDRRLRVLREPQQRGTAAARNRGAALASHDWVLFAEVDCSYPADFAATLHAAAELNGADVVGAPQAAPGEPDADAAAEPERTPVLTGPVLVRRSVALSTRYDEAYCDISEHDEVDFCLRARATGARCVRTPATRFWRPGPFPGGTSRSGLRAEYRGARNNWRFVRRHADWLAENGRTRSPLLEQASYVRTGLRRLAKRAS